MTFEEFRERVQSALDLQQDCAKADERDDDTLEGWLDELCVHLRSED